jgi:hypothetical protein
MRYRKLKINTHNFLPNNNTSKPCRTTSRYSILHDNPLVVTLSDDVSTEVTFQMLCQLKLHNFRSVYGMMTQLNTYLFECFMAVHQLLSAQRKTTTCIKGRNLEGTRQKAARHISKYS